MTYDEYVTWISHSNEYWQGFTAWWNNLSRLDNPFNRNTKEWLEWDQGWEKAIEQREILRND